jgi:hypothetical protein
MTTMQMHDTIERLTRERDAAQKSAAAWERVGTDARTAERLARADIEIERGNVTARAIEHSRAVVAGIAGAMGLDTSGEGDAIHARILAEHGRLALVGAEYRRDIADLRERMTRVECDRAKLVDENARLTRERDAARAALRDASRCEDCGAWATRYHTASASYCCDSCGVGDGWADDTHAPALRAAMRAS